MKKQWQQYSEKYLTISIREQVLILLTGLIVICLIMFHFFIDTKLTSNKMMKTNIRQLETNNRTIAVSIKEYQLASKQDPNVQVRDKITRYEKKLAQIDTKLLTLTSELINPIQMRYALLELLKVEKGVELLSFELTGAEPLLNQTSEPLNKNSATSENKDSIKIKQSVAERLLSQTKLASDLQNKNSATSASETEATRVANNRAESENSLASTDLNLYKHGIKIKLSGEYFALQRYLQQLEQLSWKFFWQKFNFEVTEYPKNELSIEIYSLGFKKEFVGV
jgi:MSHA biogenesis protein MshJ